MTNLESALEKTRAATATSGASVTLTIDEVCALMGRVVTLAHRAQAGGADVFDVMNEVMLGSPAPAYGFSPDEGIVRTVIGCGYGYAPGGGSYPVEVVREAGAVRIVSKVPPVGE